MVWEQELDRMILVIPMVSEKEYLHRYNLKEVLKLMEWNAM